MHHRILTCAVLRDAATNTHAQRMTTPQGRVPTAISPIFLYVVVSTTATALERPQATYSFAPSGVSAMFQGRLPTSTCAIMVLVEVSSTCTVPAPPALTNTRLPSGCTVMPLDRLAAFTCAITSPFATSITET